MVAMVAKWAATEATAAMAAMAAKWAATAPMVVRATTFMAAWVDRLPTSRDHMPVCKAAMAATETNRTASTVGE